MASSALWSPAPKKTAVPGEGGRGGGRVGRVGEGCEGCEVLLGWFWLEGFGSLAWLGKVLGLGL